MPLRATLRVDSVRLRRPTGGLNAAERVIVLRLSTGPERWALRPEGGWVQLEQSPLQTKGTWWEKPGG